MERVSRTVRPTPGRPPTEDAGAQQTTGKGLRKNVENIFERTLWGSRLMMLTGVAFSLLMALGAFYMATIDAVYLLKYLGGYPTPP